MLRAYNMLAQWIQLIKSCLISLTYTLILNGSKMDFFKLTRGIRQGDPFSHYIFILAMEYLSLHIQDATFLGNWKPFNLKGYDLRVSHLLFVDDVFLFARADDTSILTLKNTIENFDKINGMEINLDKFKLWLSPNLEQDRKANISNRLQIRTANHLDNYLGYPLKHKFTASNFNSILNKIHLKLQDGRKTSSPLLKEPNSS